MPAETHRVAIVTGGASGIGFAVAQRFARSGVSVAVVDIDATAAAAVAAELPAMKGGHLGLGVDVRRREEVDTMVNRVVAKLGGVDVLVCSAGIARNVPFLETSEELFQDVMDVNVKGPLLCGQAVARAMAGRGGCIVNLASVAGQRANLGRTAYGTSKGAVIALTQVMAVELAPEGIRVNAVAPGPIDTPMVVKLHRPAEREIWTDSMAIKRYGTPDEIAAAIWFLASDDASFMTGHVLNVDGGYSAAGIIRRPKQL